MNIDTSNVSAQPDNDSVRFLEQFADMFRSGAQGCQMNYDAAQALALSIDDALQALRSNSAVGVVKPLEWAPIGTEGSDLDAETPFGVYCTSKDHLSAGGGVYLWVAGQAENEVHHSEYRSISEAKAAAQADFNARILSCLSPAVGVKDAPEAVAEPFWLIERTGYEGASFPYWYAEDATGWHGWVSTAAQAKRFATRAEAEGYPAYVMIAEDPAIKVTEHVMISPTPVKETLSDDFKILREQAQKLADDITDFGETLAFESIRYTVEQIVWLMYAFAPVPERIAFGEQVIERTWPECLDPNASHNRRKPGEG